MSEATLTKIQADCSKLEAELDVYKNSMTMNNAAQQIIAHINANPEPLCARTDPNPWHSSGGGGGGCLIS